MTNNTLAKDVVDKMMTDDHFSKWLGIELVDISVGKAILKMQIRKEMLNGFGIAHGGIIFSLADSALAFASNSYGRRSVSIEASISWPKSIGLGDEVVAETELKSLTNKTAIFDVNIKNIDQEIIGLFRGVVYRTSKNWFE
ncbi:hotdog fold thioesterase [Candidatus Kapabacteria bacterium]|nr:hotdog fold thioesterase [Candidatus Kapabacteria bacterium]